MTNDLNTNVEKAQQPEAVEDNLAEAALEAESGGAAENEVAAEAGEIWKGEEGEDAELERIAQQMGTTAEKFALWPEKKRKVFEIVGGLLLGSLSGSALTFIPSDTKSFLSMGVVIALLLALVVPRILENKLKTQFRTLKKYLILALAVYIAIMGIFALTNGSPLING